MKRFLATLAAAVVMSLTPAATVISSVSTGQSVTPVAMAVPVEGDGVPKASGAPAGNGCVKLSVKILESQGNEVCPSGEGGVIIAYLKIILQFMALAIGAVVILMIVLSGFQYVTSVGSPDDIKSAKKRLTNAITGLILYLFAFAIINFIVPGGLF